MDAINPPLSTARKFILGTDGTQTNLPLRQDQVWSFTCGGGEFPALTLSTTYGLRVNTMRVYPSFIVAGNRITDPASFHKPPQVLVHSPGYIQVGFCPWQGLTLQLEIFLPEQQVVVGGLTARNTGEKKIDFTFELAAVLRPMGKGIPTKPERVGNNQIISGQADDICPVLFMTDGPSATSSPAPALAIPLSLEPDESHFLTWSLSSKKAKEESLDAARRIVRKDWRRDAQLQWMTFARDTILISSGKPDWDSAFYLSQITAQKLRCADNDGKSFFIRSRSPDESRDQINDLSKTDDISVLEALHLSQILIPSRLEQVQDLVENFLNLQTTDGELYSRLNPKAFGLGFYECPLLAQLCLEIHKMNHDAAFLETAFPKLTKNFDRWFMSEEGKASDQYPLLTNPQQLQLNTGMFTFDFWQESGKGLDIHMVKSPALGAMLVQEGMALSQIARITGKTSLQKHFEKTVARLSAQINQLWNEHTQCFGYADRDSHLAPKGDLVYRGPFQKQLVLKKNLQYPQRFQLHLSADDEKTRVGKIVVKGKNQQGHSVVEQFKTRGMRWSLGRAHITTQNLYQTIQSIETSGFKAADQMILETADFSQVDITCLLPLWMETISCPRVEALTSHYLNPADENLKFGIPEVFPTEQGIPDGLQVSINVLWNTLIIQSLLRAGSPNLARDHFSNLMETILKGLRDFGGLFPFFDHATGKPLGKPNTIPALVPLKLFLEIAGIRLFSPYRVAIWGSNPFPNPIEVHWQGLSIRREGSQTDLTFPSGEIYNSESEEPTLITQAEI